MTYLENLEPLIKAAEAYAKAVDGKGAPSEKLLAEYEAEDALLNAAVKFAQWGKNLKEKRI